MSILGYFVSCTANSYKTKSCVNMSGILKVYKNLLLKYPMTVQCFQTGLLMGAGDQIAQNFIEKREFKDLDFKRTATFTSLGWFVTGPILKTWFKILDKKIGSATKTAVFKKVIVDQTMFAPVFTGLVVSLVGATQGNDLEGIKKKLENEYGDILINHYKLWPMVQLINFSIVPLEYQVLVVMTVALFWNTYFSYRTNRGVRQHASVH